MAAGMIAKKSKMAPRNAAVLVSFLFIPAFMFGFVSVWSFVIAYVISVVWRRRLQAIEAGYQDMEEPKEMAVYIRGKLFKAVIECSAIIMIPQFLCLVLLQLGMEPFFTFMDGWLYDLVTLTVFSEQLDVSVRDSVFGMFVSAGFLYAITTLIGVLFSSFWLMWRMLNIVFFRKMKKTDSYQRLIDGDLVGLWGIAAISYIAVIVFGAKEFISQNFQFVPLITYFNFLMITFFPFLLAIFTISAGACVNRGVDDNISKYLKLKGDKHG